jgi:hypothetical protein
MFWAAFSGALRRSGLVDLYGDPDSPNKGVNRFVILDLYQRILPTLLIDPSSIFNKIMLQHTLHRSYANLWSN